MKLTYADVIRLLSTEYPILNGFGIEVVKQFTTFGENLANTFLIKTTYPVLKIFIAKGHGLKPGGLENEWLALQYIQQKELHVPKLLVPHHKPFNLLLIEYIDAENLQNVLKKDQNPDKLFFEIGKIVGKLHTISVKHIGRLIDKRTQTWEEFQTQKFRETSEKLKSILDPTLLKKINDFLASYLHLLKSDTSPIVLQHRDIYINNFIVNRKREVYLIDFAMASGGKALYELAKFYIIDLYRFPQFQESFLKGYKKIQTFPNNYKELMKFYIFRESLGIIKYAHETDDIKFKVHGITILKEILNNSGKIMDLVNYE